MDTEIVLKNIKLSYQNRPVLDDINLSIAQGETVCLVGPSGCGKSSLLRIMAGLMPPDSGQVFYQGTDINRVSEAKFHKIQEQTGFMFQDAALISNLNIYDNIALPLRYNFKTDEAALKKKIVRLLAPFDLIEQMDQRPATLSIGKQKLVSLLRAMITKPNILFYDDPISNIDRVSAKTVVALMKRKIAISEVTSIISSGDIDFATDIAEKLFIMYNGSVIASGSVSEIMATEDPFVQRIIDTIKTNE